MVDINIENMHIPTHVMFHEKAVNLELYRFIDTNVYNIPEQLKEIDSGYFVLYNRRSGKFEIHSWKNKTEGTYCLSVPYEELDSRVLDLVRKTRAENFEKILQEIEECNEKVRRDKRNQFRDYVGEVAKDIYNYGQRSGSESRILSKGGNH